MKAYIDANKANTIRACVATSNPVLLIGETGLGKTTIIREMANENGKNLVRVSLNGSTSIEEILGKWLAKEGTTFWQDGVLIEAMKKGDWIVFDEINAALPEVLFVLHSLLDDDRKVTIIEKNNEVEVPHPDFRFFATMNPTEEYAGTKEVNKALMSRFTAVINIEVPSAEVEVNIMKDKGIDSVVATQLVELAGKLRKKKADDEIYYFCSTRDLIHAGTLIGQGIPFEDATFSSIFGKMSKQERDFLGGLVKFKSGIKRGVDEIIREANDNKIKADALTKDILTSQSENKTLREEILRLNKIVETVDTSAQKEKMKEMFDKVIAEL